MTQESKEQIASFVEQYEPAYPILCKGKGGVGQYSTGGVPTAYLIGAGGQVLWHGHPGNLGDDEIEEQLKEVAKKDRVSTWSFLVAKALPEIPEKLAAVKKALDKRKFGDALKKVESALPRLEGEDAEAGEQIRAWIEGVGTKGMEQAAALVTDGKVYQGYLKYEELEDRFKGHALAKQVKDAIKALKKDKQHALEIKASEKLEKIKQDMAGERKPEDKLKCLKPLLSKKYVDTLAGRTAAEMAEELEKAVDK